MRSAMRQISSTVAFILMVAGYGLASPLNSRLLPLVPSGAEIVAGFAPSPHQGARLLLTTRNNRIDLEDWQALTGADSGRALEEVIEVAASDGAGHLAEHLLLAAGRFDRERIFRSLQTQGTEAVEFEGQRALRIAPFARERGDMLDDRWLIILDNRTGILGTPELARAALRRYLDHALPDPVLEERLRLFRPDVTSWNVLVGRGAGGRPLQFAHAQSAWAELQQDTDLLMIGVRFGEKARIDFSIHAEGEGGIEFLTRKAEFFTAVLTAGPEPRAARMERAQRHPANFAVRANRLQGSVELSRSQFNAWCEQFERAPEAEGPARGN